MIEEETAQSRTVAVHADAPAERLFFTQFRLWMAGYSLQDPLYLDCAFDILLHFTPLNPAKVLYHEFQLFTRTLTEQTRREIVWRLAACRCICRDEFLALRLVAASQRNNPAEEQLAASELIGSHHVTPVVKASRSLAHALELGRFILAPVERLPIIARKPGAPQSYTLQ